MALQPFSIAVGVGSNDPLVEATNYKVGAEVYVKLTSSGNPLATVYLDEAGASPIIQPIISNDRGMVEFFAQSGQYILEFNNGTQLLSTRIVVGSNDHSDLANRNAAGAHDAIYPRNFKTVSDLKAGIDADGKTINMALILGAKVFWRGYYAESDGGSNWGIVKSGAHVEDGGSIFSIDLDTYVEANLKGQAINGLKFGMKPLGGDCTAQYQAFRDYMAGTLVNLNRQAAVIPAGRYEYTVSPNWAIRALELRFEGEVWLINNGTGSSFTLDGGATGPGVNGMIIRGYPRVYGGPSTKHGYYIRALHRSELEINCRGAGDGFAGLYQEWNVSNTIKFIMNFNDGGLYNIPAYGIYQTLRAANEETSYCTMINNECSGMPIGIYQDGALGNVFNGGAIQACTNKGLVQTPNSWNNKFYGTDFEVNTDIDIECDGRENQFFGVDCEKKIVFKSNAVNCAVFGGVTENVQIDSGAERTLLSGLTYNRFGAGTITDNSLTTRYRDVRNKGLSEVSNKPRAMTPITVGASPFTYTNTSGNEEDILISGGTVTQVAWIRFAGYVVPTSGLFTLSPSDSISVTYTAAPVMIAVSR